MENISRRRLGYFSVLLQILPPPPKQNNDTLWERRTFSLRPSIGPRYLDRKNSGWPESVGFYRIYGVESRLTNVLALLPFNPTEMLVGTAKDGLFILHENGKATPWEVNPLL